MSNRKTILVAVVIGALGQAALATTGATSNSEESFVIHPTARSESSSLTREQVRSELAAARQANAALDIWTAADGGNPARLAGGNAAASLSPSALVAAPAASPAQRGTGRPAHTVYFGNVD